MGQEIERKWLITELPADISGAMRRGEYSHSSITQGYLCTDPVVRVRQDGGRWILTCKGKGRLNRREDEFPLTKEAFDHLISKCDGIVLEKERYRIPASDDGSLLIELDIFHGCYEGLIYAEVESPDEAAAGSFIPPDWFGRELTFEKGWSNAALSLAKPQPLC